MENENIESPFDSDSSENILNTPQTNKSEFDNDNKNIIRNLQSLSLNVNDFSPRKDKEPLNDPSMDLIAINDESVLDDEDKSIYKDDMVYLSSIYNSIGTLNKKMNKILNKKYINKDIISSTYKYLQSGNIQKAKEEMEKCLLKKEISKIKTEEVQSFTKSEFPKFYTKIITQLDALEKIKTEVFEEGKKITEYLKSKIKSSNMYKEEIYMKMKNFKVQLNSINEKYKIEDFENEEMLFKSLMSLFTQIYKDIQAIKNENNFLKTNSDIKELKRQLEEKKMAVKKLQEENISFSEAITKLDTNNIRLKKECVIISSEYKKVVDSNKLKNKIIEKQKKIIDVLQKQLGNKNENPIDDMKAKMNKIEMKLKSETNLEIKKKLEKEFNDYQKRIADFELISENKK